MKTLRGAGHDVKPLGVADELKPIRDEIENWKPNVVVTLLEEFQGEAIYDQNVTSFLELIAFRIPAAIRAVSCWRAAGSGQDTGALPPYSGAGLTVFPIGRKARRPARLALPLIVKSLNEDGSYGISQASVVDTDDKLVERVGFIHDRIGTLRSSSNISKAAKSMLAYSVTIGCACCRFGS